MRIASSTFPAAAILSFSYSCRPYAAFNIQCRRVQRGSGWPGTARVACVLSEPVPLSVWICRIRLVQPALCFPCLECCLSSYISIFGVKFASVHRRVACPQASRPHATQRQEEATL